MKKIIVSVFMLAFIVVSAEAKKDGDAAKAPKKKGGPEAIFKKADADGNGSLNLEEYLACRVAPQTAALKKAGKSKEEIKQAIEKKKRGLGKRFKKADGDGDGSLSVAEFKAIPKPGKKKKAKADK